MIKLLAREICKRNLEEQLTALFEIENGVDFSTQTPDEISLIMLNKIGFKRNE